VPTLYCSQISTRFIGVDLTMYLCEMRLFILLISKPMECGGSEVLFLTVVVVVVVVVVVNDLNQSTCQSYHRLSR